MTEKKLIDWRLSKPHNSMFKQFRNDKAQFKLVYCDNSENCEAYKKGACVMFSFSAQKCPHGTKSVETGFTPKARKYFEWIKEREDRVKDIPQLDEQAHMFSTGEYIWNRFDNWTNDSRMNESNKRIMFAAGKQFIPKNDFTPEFIQKMIEARPQAMFGGTIKSWTEKDVPRMVRQIKTAFPDIYEAWASKYPAHAEQYANISDVGRKAILQTLSPGVVINNKKKGIMVWDGEYVTCDNFYDLWFDIKGHASVKIKPRERFAIEVISDNLVNDNTEFVD